MKDKDKVMQALDCLAHGGGHYDCLKFPCPYEFYGYTDCHTWEIARDALKLLKEKEAKPDIFDGGVKSWFICGNCGETIHDNDKYCRQCGAKVKWV